MAIRVVGFSNGGSKIGKIFAKNQHTQRYNLKKKIITMDYGHPDRASFQKLLGLRRQIGVKHLTPKCSQNNILAEKNLEKGLHTSILDAPN